MYQPAESTVYAPGKNEQSAALPERVTLEPGGENQQLHRVAHVGEDQGEKIRVKVASTERVGSVVSALRDHRNLSVPAPMYNWTQLVGLLSGVGAIRIFSSRKTWRVLKLRPAGLRIPFKDGYHLS